MEEVDEFRMRAEYGDCWRLKGKTIKEIRLSTDAKIIMFTTTSGENLSYVAEGDCCSSSWIEHFTGVSALFDSTITNIVELDLSEMNFDDSESEYIKVYAYQFQTPKGCADLQFRNSSNGYYGGSLEWIEPGVIEFEAMKLITEDF